MPEISAVSTLVAPTEAKSRANSLPQASINKGINLMIDETVHLQNPPAQVLPVPQNPFLEFLHMRLHDQTFFVIVPLPPPPNTTTYGLNV
jgi:hypothetical protein